MGVLSYVGGLGLVGFIGFRVFGIRFGPHRVLFGWSLYPSRYSRSFIRAFCPATSKMLGPFSKHPKPYKPDKPPTPLPYIIMKPGAKATNPKAHSCTLRRDGLLVIFVAKELNACWSCGFRASECWVLGCCPGLRLQLCKGCRPPTLAAGMVLLVLSVYYTNALYPKTLFQSFIRAHFLSKPEPAESVVEPLEDCTSPKHPKSPDVEPGKMSLSRSIHPSIHPSIYLSIDR